MATVLPSSIVLTVCYNPVLQYLHSPNVLTAWIQHSLKLVQRVDCLATTQSYSAYTRITCWLSGYNTVLHSYNVLTVSLQYSPTIPTLVQRVDCLDTTVSHSFNVLTVRRSCAEVLTCFRYTSCIPRHAPCTTYTSGASCASCTWCASFASWTSCTWSVSLWN